MVFSLNVFNKQVSISGSSDSEIRSLRTLKQDFAKMASDMELMRKDHRNDLEVRCYNLYNYITGHHT